MTTFPSGKASQADCEIVPFSVNVILVIPPSIVYHIESRFASLISTLKDGAPIPNKSSELGDRIRIVGAVTSFLTMTSS